MEISGHVLYVGPSRLGKKEPIIGVVTHKTANTKTGDMHQLWILVAGEPPTEAIKSGADIAICGNCKYRWHKTVGTAQQNCYVTPLHGPQPVWKSWKAGTYPALPKAFRFAKPLRMAAYGDPAALPKGMIADLAARCDAGWTGYTHQWKRYPGLRHYCMASVDSIEEFWDAKKRGWRTYRSGYEPANYPRWEINCPASKESGHRTTCAQCLLCNGDRTNQGTLDRRKNIQINPH
jgi:hypothetical protein